MKTKLGFITLSIIVLTLLPLMKNNFGAPVILKKWSPLSWDDFEGIARPFSAFAAGISSSIYLELDSTNEIYRAYSAQNNQRSWAKSNLYDPEYVLNHEQYHFNISEVHARMFNKKLASSDDLDPYELLGSYRSNLQVMQKHFDKETDHGRRIDIQRKWEYQIDSMLQKYTIDSTFTNELYSGAQVFFPIVPAYNEGTLDNVSFKSYSINRYNMFISMFCYIQDQTAIDFNILMEQKCSKDSLVMQSFKKQNSRNGEVLIMSAIDTAINTKEINHLYYLKPYICLLYVKYPLNDYDTIGYEQIADSFFNSFSIVNTNNHFLSKSSNARKINLSRLTKDYNLKQKTSESSQCMIYLPSKAHNFYRGPINKENGDMLFAFDVIEHCDSLLFKDIILIDTMMFDSEIVNGGQILTIQKEYIPETNYYLSFGYFLLEDSSKACYNYYNQRIYIDHQSH